MEWKQKAKKKKQLFALGATLDLKYQIYSCYVMIDFAIATVSLCIQFRF